MADVTIELTTRHLSPSALHTLRRLGRYADEQGVSLYLVGGVVRDILLDRPVHDLDVVVEGDGIAFAQGAAARFHGKIVDFTRFGTAILYFPDGVKLDVATARREFYPQPAVLPTVEPSTIWQDLYRRDFTINAMAVSLNQQNFGRLVDYFGGRADLAKGELRVLHSRSFLDDPTRILRGFRFAERLGFTLTAETYRLMTEALQQGIFHRVSSERLRDELCLLLSEQPSVHLLRKMEETGVWRNLFPEIHLSCRVSTAWERIPDGYHSLKLLPESVRFPWLPYFLVLLHGHNTVDLAAIADKWRFSREEKRALAAYPDRLVGVARFTAVTANREIYQTLAGAEPETLVALLSLFPSPLVQNAILRYHFTLRKMSLSITGKDLMALGVPQGEQLGWLLKETLYAKLDGKIGSPAEEIRFALGLFATLNKGVNHV